MKTSVLLPENQVNESIGELKAGTFLNNRYVIEEFLGEGGIAYTYTAMDLYLHKRVVVKQTKRRQRITDKISEDRFQMEREYRLLSELKAIQLPEAYDMFEIDNVLYVAREYRDGTLLTDLIKTGLSVEAIANVCWQVLDMLEYLHKRGIVYRDLKPSNILIDNHGWIFFMDFGTARFHKRRKRHDTIPLGTPGFASPEQYGLSQTTQVSDIYSFGALLYNMITGENPEDMPFEFGRPDNIHKKIKHTATAQFLIKCLELNPEERFQSVEELRFILFEGAIFRHPKPCREKVFMSCLDDVFRKKYNFLQLAASIWLLIWFSCAFASLSLNRDLRMWIFISNIELIDRLYEEYNYIKDGFEAELKERKISENRSVSLEKALQYNNITLAGNGKIKEALYIKCLVFCLMN